MIVTGGKGFIGTNFINKYGGESYDIKESREEDVRRRYSLSRFMRAHSEIIHLAAESGIPSSIENPRYSFNANVAGTFNVLEEAKENKAKIILASSAAADNCSTPYAAFKRAGELMAKAYHETYGLQYTVLRFANVYGPHSMHKTSVVAQMCKDALTKGEITVNGNCERDFIHVDDVCTAIRAAIENPVNNILYIGRGKAIPIYDIAGIIASEANAKIKKANKRNGDIEEINSPLWDYVFSTKNTIDWEPEIELIDGILETLEWFRENM